MKASRGRGRFDVTADGRGSTGRAGTAWLSETADALGLTRALSRAAAGCRSWALHDPGKVLRDVVVMLADGGDALRHLAVLAADEALHGPVASASTANRTLVALAQRELAVEALCAARRQARRAAWAAGGAPPVVAAAAAGERPCEPLCIDIDATLITAHSDGKDGAAPTYKRTFGFHPLLAYLDRGDGLGESLGGMLRPGNAGANTAADHIDCFETALWQLEGLVPDGVQLVVRADAAGCSYALLDWLRQAEVGFSVGFAVDADVRAAIADLPAAAWTPARRQDGSPRNADGDDRAAVAELTGDARIDLGGYPQGARLLVRREPLHPGAQQTIDDIDGCRFTCFLTDQPDADLAALDVRHRGHARVEDRIRGAKDSGARNLPCEDFARNAVWLQLVLGAQDLTVWGQVLCLHGPLRVAEPASLRYKLLHAPARVTRSGRRLTLRINHDWPWAHDLLAAFRRLRALPVPAD